MGAAVILVPLLSDQKEKEINPVTPFMTMLYHNLKRETSVPGIEARLPWKFPGPSETVIAGERFGSPYL
jgi:hypothetical protein